VMMDHAARMFKACKSVGASYTVRDSFIHVGFIYSANPDGGTLSGLTKRKFVTRLDSKKCGTFISRSRCSARNIGILRGDS
jgi:hypothetical protein